MLKNPSSIAETVSEIVVHLDEGKPCTFRDVSEPVEFDFCARLRVEISRFSDVIPGMSAERLAQIVIETLAEQSISLAHHQDDPSQLPLALPHGAEKDWR